MKFSIIIPVHNAEDRITRALDIIASQTFKDYELICVCDACTDRSASICRGYTKNVYEVDFGNDGLTRSYGLDRAQGEWVMFHDDDDFILADDVLENLNKALTDNFDILCCGFVWKGYGIMTPFYMNDESKGLWVNVWSKVWRRSAIGDIRFPNVHSVSDMHFNNAVMSQEGIRIATLNYPFYYYNYMRKGSITEIDERKKINK